MTPLEPVSHPAPGEPRVLRRCQRVPKAEVLGQAGLTVEPVHLGDLPALVVAPQQRDTVRPLGF